jgi:hypothetical protein
MLLTAVFTLLMCQPHEAEPAAAAAPESSIA